MGRIARNHHKAKHNTKNETKATVRFVRKFHSGDAGKLWLTYQPLSIESVLYITYTQFYTKSYYNKTHHRKFVVRFGSNHNEIKIRG